MAITLDKVYNVQEKMLGKAKDEEEEMEIIAKNPEYEHRMADTD